MPLELGGKKIFLKKLLVGTLCYSFMKYNYNYDPPHDVSEMIERVAKQHSFQIDGKEWQNLRFSDSDIKGKVFTILIVFTILWNDSMKGAEKFGRVHKTLYSQLSAA